METPQTRETVGGLAITYQDAITYHEENGNHQLAEQIRNAGLATFESIGSITVVGESHLRTIVDEENESQFQKELGSAEIIIIEHNSDHNNPYNQVGPEKRFMQEAQEHAVQQGKKLIILDDELGTDIASKFALLEQGNFGVTSHEYAYMISINTLMGQFMSGNKLSDVRVALIERLQNIIPNIDASKIVEEATFHFLTSLQDSEKLGAVQSIIGCFAAIDATAREQGYQRFIQGVIDGTDSNIAIIVGKSHTKPITNTVSNGELTVPNINKVNEFRSARQLLEQ